MAVNRVGEVLPEPQKSATSAFLFAVGDRRFRDCAMYCLQQVEASGLSIP